MIRFGRRYTNIMTFVGELNKQLAAHGLRLSDKTPTDATDYVEFQLESTAVPTTQDGVGIAGKPLMVEVTSGNIHAVGYESATNELRVQFKRNGVADDEVYVYQQVTAETLLGAYDDMMLAQQRGTSVGAAFAKWKPHLTKFRKVRK